MLVGAALLQVTASRRRGPPPDDDPARAGYRGAQVAVQERAARRPVEVSPEGSAAAARLLADVVAIFARPGGGGGLGLGR